MRYLSIKDCIVFLQGCNNIYEDRDLINLLSSNGLFNNKRFRNIFRNESEREAFKDIYCTISGYKPEEKLKIVTKYLEKYRQDIDSINNKDVLFFSYVIRKLIMYSVILDIFSVFSYDINPILLYLLCDCIENTHVCIYSDKKVYLGKDECGYLSLISNDCVKLYSDGYCDGVGSILRLALNFDNTVCSDYFGIICSNINRPFFDRSALLLSYIYPGLACMSRSDLVNYFLIASEKIAYINGYIDFLEDFILSMYRNSVFGTDVFIRLGDIEVCCDFLYNFSKAFVKAMCENVDNVFNLNTFNNIKTVFDVFSKNNLLLSDSCLYTIIKSKTSINGGMLYELTSAL